MILRLPLVAVIICLLMGRADACVVKFKQRSLSISELNSAKELLYKQYPNAIIDLEGAGVFGCGQEPQSATLRFESERARVDNRFCRAVSGSLQGALNESESVVWDALNPNYFSYIIFEQKDQKTCNSPASGRSLYVDSKVSYDTAEWVLNNSGVVWNEYVIVAMKRYGSDFELTTTSPALVAVNQDAADRLSVSFRGQNEASFHAVLAWIGDRWIVKDAFVALP